MRELTRGHQENRIRRYSPPAAIFEFFASIRKWDKTTKKS
jgi:hypothetical protein